MQSLVLLAYLHKCSGSSGEEDERFILHDEMMKYIHLACSEAFDVQLQDCWSSELVDGVP